MPNIGPMEILVVLIIALVVFGPKRLPELGNSLGKGIREFKGTISGESTEEEPPAALEKPAAAEQRIDGHVGETTDAPTETRV